MRSELDWVSIPGGAVRLGTETSEVVKVFADHANLEVEHSFFAKEAPAHTVHVPGFTISRVPITWRQWELSGGDPAKGAAPDEPVDGVSWSAALRFCDWASGQFGHVVTLPSESQWERAARGDDSREYPWGNTWDRRAANTAELGVGHALPVGTLLRGSSPFGVLDLAGNVDEWTANEYRPYPGASADAPRVEEWANDPHVTRGGGWYQGRDLARCARRHALYGRHTGAGFRVVITEP